MKTYELSSIIGNELISRLIAGDLYSIVANTSNGEDVIMDFAGVYFMTRSFADEFYNLFLKQSPSKVKIVNASEDIKTMFEIVAKTQNIVKTAATDEPKRPKTIKEFDMALSAIGI